MWNAIKNSLVRSGKWIATGLRWWLDSLGQNPSIARDPGFLAWEIQRARERQALGDAEGNSDLPAGEVVAADDRPKGFRPSRPLAAGAAGSAAISVVVISEPGRGGRVIGRVAGRVVLRRRRGASRSLFSPLRFSQNAAVARSRRNLLGA